MMVFWHVGSVARWGKAFGAALLPLLLCLGICPTAQAQTPLKYLQFVQPGHDYDVLVTAGSGWGDGTQELIWVRLYSSQAERWSRWVPMAGAGRNQTRSIQISESADFGSISQVDVFVSAKDPARLTVEVIEMGSGWEDAFVYGPEAVWVKGSTKTLTAITYSTTSHYSRNCNCNIGDDCGSGKFCKLGKCATPGGSTKFGYCATKKWGGSGGLNDGPDDFAIEQGGYEP